MGCGASIEHSTQTNFKDLLTITQKVFWFKLAKK